MVDAFRMHIMQTKELGTCPVRQIGGCSFFYMRISNVYIVIVVSSNANVACAFKFVVEVVPLLVDFYFSLDLFSNTSNYAPSCSVWYNQGLFLQLNNLLNFFKACSVGRLKKVLVLILLSAPRCLCYWLETCCFVCTSDPFHSLFHVSKHTILCYAGCCIVQIILWWGFWWRCHQK